MPPKPPRRRPLWLAVAAAVMLLVVVGVPLLSTGIAVAHSRDASEPVARHTEDRAAQPTPTKPHGADSSTANTRVLVFAAPPPLPSTHRVPHMPASAVPETTAMATSEHPQRIQPTSPSAKTNGSSGAHERTVSVSLSPVEDGRRAIARLDQRVPIVLYHPARKSRVWTPLLQKPAQARAYFDWVFQLAAAAANRSAATAVLTAGGANMHWRALQQPPGWDGGAPPQSSAAAERDVVVHRNAARIDAIAGALNAEREAAAATNWSTVASTNRSVPAIGRGDPLEVLLCPRPWLGHFLKAAANGTALPPLKKMGEVRAWVPLMRALYRLGCVVGVSTSERCEWWRGFAAGHAAGRERVVLVEELSKAFLRHHGKQACETGVGRVIATANERANFAPAAKTLTPFREIKGWPMGVMASCPHRGSPFPPRKRWFGLLWGKARQSMDNEFLVSQLVSVLGVIPLVATCSEDCDAVEQVSVPNLSLVPREVFSEMVASALVMVGMKAARFGASVAEALACGTYVVAQAENIPREFHSHPLVRIVQLYQYAPTIKKIMQLHGFNKLRTIERQKNPPLHRIPPPLGWKRRPVANATSSNGTANATALDYALPSDFMPYPAAWCNRSTAWQPVANVTNCVDPRSFAFRSWLPRRYTEDGHTEWIRRTFGVDHKCRVVNRQAPIQSLLAANWSDECG